MIENFKPQNLLKAVPKKLRISQFFGKEAGQSFFEFPFMKF
jgi:hypothetical protein